MKKYLPLLALAVFAVSAFVVIGLCMGVKLPEIIACVASAAFFAGCGVIALLIGINALNRKK